MLRRSLPTGGWGLIFWLLLLLTGLRPAQAQAQKPHTISGIVRATGGEVLPGASVAVPALGVGATADERGAYSLTLPNGSYQLVVSFIGFETQTRALSLTRNQRLNFGLAEAGNQLGEVVVQGSQSLEQKLKTTQMSVERLTAQEAKLLPALFGEVDILRTLQLKPGVQNGGEGTTGLFVRGGAADQNLVLLDDALVYNPSHLFGLFSVFNPDAVQSVDLYKGGFPAQYGGRLSSVVDVKMRPGNAEKIGVSGGIGLISSRLALEGPIKKGKGAFLVAGRRTYFDVFTRQINRLNADDPEFNPIPDYYFYDFNAKANYKLGPKDELFLTGYLGNDVFGFNSQNGFNFNFNWGNRVASLRWNHVYNSRLFLNTTVSYTGYKYEITNRLDQFKFSLASDIQDLTLRSDLDYRPNDQHELRFGAIVTNHRFGTGRLQAGSEDGRINFGSDTRYTGQEGAVYASDVYKPNEKWQFEYGLRASGFQSQGAGNRYGGLEPRAAARYAVKSNVSLKASYALMYQYVHLVTNSGASLPTDIWYPSRESVRPQRSQQVAAGVSWLLGDGRYLITNEVYYKWAQRQIDFRDGAQLFVNPDLDAEFLFGKGWAYGNELYLEKKQGRLTGWVGYTLAWTNRRFPAQRGTAGINNGNSFFPIYDRRHNISVVGIYNLSDRLKLTSAFVFSSGQPTTLPLARFLFQDVFGEGNGPVPVYPQRNTLRLAPVNRLDIGVVWQMKPTRWIPAADLTFSIYNAYNRRNPFFVFFEQQKDPQTDQTTGFRARQVSLFPVIPSVTYNFKF